MKVTASSLIRWSGLAALVAGLIFAGIQPIHPPDVLSSVTTGEWAIITTLKTAMCLLFLIGSTAPGFVDGLLGISYGHTGGIDLGALPAIYGLIGILYMLGGVLFGIATLRASVLPRWPAGLLAVAAALTPAAALFPHAIQRLAAIPVALAIAWLGYALLSERRARASESVPGRVSPQLRERCTICG
jgi:hypothetical protein